MSSSPLVSEALCSRVTLSPMDRWRLLLTEILVGFLGKARSLQRNLNGITETANTTEVIEGLGKREKQWTEISWEPRAFIYHNFRISWLVSSFLLFLIIIFNIFSTK